MKPIRYALREQMWDSVDNHIHDFIMLGTAKQIADHTIFNLDFITFIIRTVCQDQLNETSTFHT
jgi:hypothetical protein